MIPLQRLTVQFISTFATFLTVFYTINPALLLLVVGGRIGPASAGSLISNKYLPFYVSDYARRYIYLEGKYSYSVQLVLHKGDVHPSTSNSSVKGAVEFIIKAPEYSYYGVMAVIQSINFRKNPFTQGDDGCRDYVQFSEFHSETQVSEDSSRSPKICGKLPRGNKDFKPSTGLQGSRTYFNPKGGIRLLVHVDSVVSMEDWIELSTVGAEIVFTAFIECPGTNVGLKTLSRCSSTESLSCIQSSLICDSKIDCGFEDNFGLDENERCYFPYLYAGVALLIILLMLLFLYGFVHWVRMKSKQWHASSNPLNQNPPSSSNEQASRGGDPASMCEAAMESVDAMDASMGAF